MRETFLDAVRKLVYQTRSVDHMGLVNYIPQHLLEDLEYEFKAYCRKHGVRARAKKPAPVQRARTSTE